MCEEGNHLNKSEPQPRLSLALPGVWQATSNTEGEGHIEKENTIKIKPYEALDHRTGHGLDWKVLPQDAKNKI